MALDKNQIAQRIAQELKHNTYVNLGIGIPTLVANFIPQGIDVEFQSENGILGTGPFPLEGEEDPDMINAGKQTITTLPGAALFDSSTSFAMIRGQHVQLTVLGAMDLVASAENIIVAMMHTNRQGESKILKKCTLPITGVNCVKKVVTNLAVLEVTDRGFKLLERAPDVCVEDIKNATESDLIIEGKIPEMKL